MLRQRLYAGRGRMLYGKYKIMIAGPGSSGGHRAMLWVAVGGWWLLTCTSGAATLLSAAALSAARWASKRCNTFPAACCLGSGTVGTSLCPAPRLKSLLPGACPSLQSKSQFRLRSPRGGRGCGAAQRLPGVALQMTQQCRKEARGLWNRPLPLLHPICAPCLSNNIQNHGKIWTAHSL